MMSEGPASVSRLANHGSCVSGTTPVCSIFSPKNTSPTPKMAEATVRNSESRSKVKEMPAIPSTNSTNSWMLRVAIRIRKVAPTLAPVMIGSAAPTLSRPLAIMLARMKVTAVVLCITPPATTPRPRPAKRPRVHTATSCLKRRPASFLRFSFSRYMPAKKMPSPPRAVAIVWIMNAGPAGRRRGSAGRSRDRLDW